MVAEKPVHVMACFEHKRLRTSASVSRQKKEENMLQIRPTFKRCLDGSRYLPASLECFPVNSGGGEKGSESAKRRQQRNSVGVRTIPTTQSARRPATTSIRVRCYAVIDDV